VKKVLRFFKAVYCWVTGGCVLTVSAEDRMSICEECEHYLNGVCSVCGCVLKIKTKMDTEKCPINKW